VTFEGAASNFNEISVNLKAFQVIVVRARQPVVPNEKRSLVTPGDSATILMSAVVTEQVPINTNFSLRRERGPRGVGSWYLGTWAGRSTMTRGGRLLPPILILRMLHLSSISRILTRPGAMSP